MVIINVSIDVFFKYYIGIGYTVTNLLVWDMCEEVFFINCYYIYNTLLLMQTISQNSQKFSSSMKGKPVQFQSLPRSWL